MIAIFSVSVSLNCGLIVSAISSAEWVEAFLDRVCEFPDDLRVFFDIAFLSAVGGVGHISGVFSEGRDYIAVSFLFQGCREGFELDGVVGIIAGERCRLKLSSQ